MALIRYREQDDQFLATRRKGLSCAESAVRSSRARSVFWAVVAASALLLL